jgi:hypothetical protein
MVVAAERPLLRHRDLVGSSLALLRTLYAVGIKNAIAARDARTFLANRSGCPRIAPLLGCFARNLESSPDSSRFVALYDVMSVDRKFGFSDRSRAPVFARMVYKTCDGRNDNYYVMSCIQKTNSLGNRLTPSSIISILSSGDVPQFQETRKCYIPNYGDN